MEAIGNVVFSSEQEQTKVETDKLNWDNKIKKIVTDSFVKETRPGGGNYRLRSGSGPGPDPLGNKKGSESASHAGKKEKE